MKKVCKIRIYPNQTQKNIINRTLGACRWIYNHYIGYNIKIYNEENRFMSAYEFSKIINKLKKIDESYMWLTEISSKALKDSICTAEKSYKRFFNKLQPKPPRFRSKKDPFSSYFFERNSIHFNTGKKNIIKIPILKNIRITERSYLPDEVLVTSGRVIKKNDKYYVSFIYDVEKQEKEILSNGIGIDVGIRTYATCTIRDNGYFEIPSFLNDINYVNLNDKIKRIQRIISNKVEINYGYLLSKYMDNHNCETPNDKTKNIMKGKATNTSQISKLYKKLRRLYEKITNYSKDKVNKIVNSLVKAKPEYITIEDLSIKSMLENNSSNTLHDHISESKFYYFRQQLESKCKEYNIELRIPKNKYFASSKICCNCGNKKKHLSLSDRVYICNECGNIIDRDLNASNNLCYLDKYKIVK